MATDKWIKVADGGAIVANFRIIVNGKELTQKLNRQNTKDYGGPYFLCETARADFARWLAKKFDAEFISG